MSTFVVLNDGWDEKSAILDPTIVGPFLTDEDAEAFIEKHPRWEPTGVLMPVDGGYAGAHVVSASTATSPEEILASWEELGLDDDQGSA